MNQQDYRKEICNHIKNNFSDIYLESKTIPKPFIGESKIKAIVLGCDPSNVTYNKRFEYVFGLEKRDSIYFKGILSNLDQVRLSLDEVYIQNIIQNYFKVETSKNKNWFECATLWMEYLKRELDEKTDRNIPVLVTSWEILKVLIGKNVIKYYSAESIYLERKIFRESENYLGRKVICLFRHRKYNLKLKRWKEYVTSIKK